MSFDWASAVQNSWIAGAEHHLTITSTNDRARELAQQAAGPGLPWLVLADEQTAGRGRGANRWWTGAGCLAFSLLLDPASHGVQRQHCGLISLASAVAVVDSVAALIEPNVAGLHWPNDVYVDDRKLSGVLVEALPDGRHIVGIGLNVNNSAREAPSELRSMVVSLADLAGGPLDRSQVLFELLERFGQVLRQLAHEPDELGRRFDQLCLQRDTVLTIDVGQQVTSGLCQGIALDGALLLATGEGLQRFYAGVLRRPD